MNQQEQFLELLKRSNELKTKNQSLEEKDPESFRIFLHFLVQIEVNLHYFEKQEYISLAKDFLSDQITADDFCYSFMAIFGAVNKQLSQMQRAESMELLHFLQPDRPELSNLFPCIYGSCESFDTDPEISMSDETELKNCAKILLFKLQEE